MPKTPKVHRKIRLPKVLIQKLRDLRDGPGSRPIPRLVNICLNNTRCVTCIKYATTTRVSSEAVDLWLDPEYGKLDSADIRARIAHALIGINIDHGRLHWNRKSKEPEPCPAMEKIAPLQ